MRDEKAFKAWIIKILTVKIKNKQKEYIKNRDYREELDVLESVEQERSEEINYGGLEIMEEFRRLNEDEKACFIVKHCFRLYQRRDRQGNGVICKHRPLKGGAGKDQAEKNAFGTLEERRPEL